MARSPIAYAFVIGILALTYPLARCAGGAQAEKDAHLGTSSLPEIIRLKTPTEEIALPGQFYRLLVIDGDFVVIFHPLEANEKFTKPKLRGFKKGDVALLETN